MPVRFRSILSRLDSVYRDRPALVGLKARLFAAMTLITLVVVPLNVAKVLLVHPPVVVPRIVVNLCIGIVALFALRELFRGKLERAGNALVLCMVLAVNVTALVASRIVQPIYPLSVGIQILAFDFVFIVFS